MSNLSWRSLLEDREEALRSLWEEYSTVLDDQLDERSFVPSFKELCRKYNLGHKKQMQLLNTHIPLCRPILNLSNDVSESDQDLAPTLPLESLVWKTLRATFEASKPAYWPIVASLNSKIPEFESHIHQFQEDEVIQEALKEIYITFVDSHMNLIKLFKTEDPDPSSHSNPVPSSDIIERAEKKFQDAKQKYDDKVRLNIEVQEAKRQLELRGNSATDSLPPKFSLDFQRLEPLGDGSHGRVYKIIEKTTHELYACKVLDLCQAAFKGSRKDKIKEEIQAMMVLRHTHIITMSAFSEEPDAFRIFMQPVADCDLEKFLVSYSQNNDTDKIRSMWPWFGCLLRALNFAHLKEIKLRDLKPANILIKGDDVYISDFSLAKDFTGHGMSIEIDEKAAGTRQYRAPETRNDKPGGRKADVFALGCVYSEMYTVIHGQTIQAFRNERISKDKTEDFRDSLKTVLGWLSELKKDHLSTHLVKTIRNMVIEDHDERFSAYQSSNLVQQKSELCCKH